MFEAPISTLHTSLKRVFNNPKEYLADVSFRFKEKVIYAHRAIILTRAPGQFVDKYLPQLRDNYHTDLLELDIHDAINYDMFLPLLRFWYTADFYDADNTSLVSPCSNKSSFSDITDYPLSTSSENSSPSQFEYNLKHEEQQLKYSNLTISDITHELEELSKQLGTPLLPPRCNTVPDFMQLVYDLGRMLDDQIATDITLNLVVPTPFYDTTFKHDTSTDITTTTFSILSQSQNCKSAVQNNHVDLLPKSFQAHKFILAAQSSYFYSLFCTEFQEASSSTIYFTRDLFNEAILDLICHFLYTDQIIIKPLKTSLLDKEKSTSKLQQRLQHNKHSLRVIQKTLYASDYIGQNDTLGKALLHEMENICHHFKCVCSECAMLLPSVLVWCDKHRVMVPKLRASLILLYSDPVHSLPILWSQRPYAYLVSSKVPCSSSLGDATFYALLNNEPLFQTRPSKSLIHEIHERIFCNVTKHNAIHVLHSLHICFSQIRSADPTPSWSRPTLELVYPLLQYTIMIVSQFFDFYCVEYPILLSCVDGIGAGFAVDFLDFLLSHVLDELVETNASSIYQGIVRDLVARQEVVKNMAIDDVLIKARSKCATYIAKHWVDIKSLGGFHHLEKTTLRQLSKDIGIPYRSLTKHFENEFSNIFSFKFKHHKKRLTNIANNNGGSEQSAQQHTRRLSLGNLMTRSCQTPNPKLRRPRALSTETAAHYQKSSPSTNNTDKELQNLSLVHLWTLPNDHRYQKDHGETEEEDQLILLRTSISFDSLTDLLLPIDGKIKTSQKKVDNGKDAQSRHLKFQLPLTPPRCKSPINNINDTTTVSYIQQHQQKKSIYRSSINNKNESSRRSPRNIEGNSDTSDEEEIPTIDDKVESLGRPLPTMDTIKHIGSVEFLSNTHVGAELESRWGKIDGSVNGFR